MIDREIGIEVKDDFSEIKQELSDLKSEIIQSQQKDIPETKPDGETENVETQKESSWEVVNGWKFVLSKWMNPAVISASFWKNSEAKGDVILNGPLYENLYDKNSHENLLLPQWWYIKDWEVVKNFYKLGNKSNKSWNFYEFNWIIWCDTNWKMHMFSSNDIESQDWSTIIRKNWEEREEITFKWAFQNGPMLVQDWVIKKKNTENKLDRTAIWFTSSWELRAVYGHNVSIGEFASFCASKWLSNTMYLDGSNWIAGIKNWEVWWDWLAKKEWWLVNPDATWLQFG